MMMYKGYVNATKPIHKWDIVPLILGSSSSSSGMVSLGRIWMFQNESLKLYEKLLKLLKDVRIHTDCQITNFCQIPRQIQPRILQVLLTPLPLFRNITWSAGHYYVSTKAQASMSCRTLSMYSLSASPVRRKADTYATQNLNAIHTSKPDPGLFTRVNTWFFSFTGFVTIWTK